MNKRFPPFFRWIIIAVIIVAIIMGVLDELNIIDLSSIEK